MLNAERIKLKLPDIAGIEQLAFTEVGDRLVAAFNGVTTSVAHNASEDQMIAAIRNAASLRVAQLRMPNETAPELSPPPLPTKGPAMPSRFGIAAQMRAMMDEARAGLQDAIGQGMAQVKAAVDEHTEAAHQVKAVTSSMAAQIRSETADVLAELGQISNMPPE